MTNMFGRLYIFFCVVSLCTILVKSSASESLQETNSLQVVVGDIDNSEETSTDNETENVEVYPNNIGLWGGWGWGNKSICVRLHAAIRMTVPVEFNDGVTRYMNLDIQPMYVTPVGYCFNSNMKTLTLKWQQNNFGRLVQNSFSMSFKLSPYNGNYTLDGLGVSYYNDQFSKDAAKIGRVQLNATNLNFLPVAVNYSYACTLTKTQIQMKVFTDDRRSNFSISMYSIQWEAFWNFRNKTSFDPAQYQCGKEEDDSYQSFAKVFLVSFLVVLIICFAILSVLMCITLYCLRRCRAEEAEGYETLN